MNEKPNNPAPVISKLTALQHIASVDAADRRDRQQSVDSAYFPFTANVYPIGF
jgi:hypothetical protein